MSDVTDKNIKAILQHSNETRKMLRELQEKIDNVNGICGMLGARVDQLEQQVRTLQVRLYSGGTTSGN